MKRSAIVFGIGVVLTISPAVMAQVGAPQPQGAPGPPPRSTALIVGQVVDGSTGQPIPEAVVTLTPPGGRGMPTLPAGLSPEIQQAMQAAAAAAAAAAGRGPAQQRVLTGADGRFLFHSLPPGRFQLAATLTGYTSSLSVTVAGNIPGLTSAVMTSSDPAVLSLREGEFATDVKLRLWKYAVVTGTVLDDGGEPAIGLTVQVARRVMVAGRVRYVPALSARTDDRGAYRISSLVPGDYLVVVPQAQVSMPTAIMSGLMETVTSGGMGGGGLALMDLMSSGVMPTDAMTGGVRIGDFMVASSGSVPLVGPDGRLLAYQTAFYPGAASPAQATVLTLQSGEERSGVNFQMRLTPTARVSGTAMGPDGPVANLGIRLVVPGDGSVSESEFDVATAITRGDGTFAFFGVPPGQFLLRAEKQPRPEIPKEALASNPAAQMMFGAGGVPPGAKEMLFAVTTVSVSGGDVDGLTLQLTPGYRVSGRIEFDSRTGRPVPPPAQIQSATIMLLPVDGRTPNLLGMASQDRPTAQGEFQTKGYQPGRYFLTLTGFGGWQVGSATLAGRDVLDTPLEIRDANLAGVLVTLVDRLAQISGTVVAAGETDLSETAVLMFPASYREWISNGMNPRRSRAVRASRNGAFVMPNVPAGEYLAIAIERSSQGELQDPAFVEKLAGVATRVTVGDQNSTVDLKKMRVTR